MTWKNGLRPSFRRFGNRQPPANVRRSTGSIRRCVTRRRSLNRETIEHPNHKNHNHSETKDRGVPAPALQADRLKIDTVYRAICECPKG